MEQRVGLVVSSFAQIDAAVKKLLAPEAFETYRQRAAGLQNRAVFEVPAILQTILERPGLTGSRAPNPEPAPHAREA